MYNKAVRLIIVPEPTSRCYGRVTFDCILNNLPSRINVRLLCANERQQQQQQQPTLKSRSLSRAGVGRGAAELRL